MARRRRRVRRRNYPVFVRIGRKRMKWGRARRKLIGKLLRTKRARSLKSASRMAKRILYKLPTYHGRRQRIKLLRRRRRKHGRRRSHGKRFIRIGGHKRSWRGLVKMHGIKKAKKIWRKHKKIGGK